MTAGILGSSILKGIFMQSGKSTNLLFFFLCLGFDVYFCVHLCVLNVEGKREAVILMYTAECA